jgi:hypothetical protein
MTENRILQQMNTVFSIFMVFFYLGVGSYLIFFENLSYIDRALKVIIGSSFLIIGIFRAFRAYSKIVEVFFSDDTDEE